ncbi:hypothetical protein DDB_G0278049 [Dictyostelium discoideum AX4]|uniref:Anaphase-promoting complex subunit 13 n=1 Tax=Dictyostelium discoideum TaxID=44689 RepID=Q54YW2_DICDI|nr:hypothetical protein DDB_G0278049 [Dictyostelium discoideum AX4]EAL68197.1 hypothetical protein DDB_G0278049 [Dictyostelium discoideum AX4]|eukprot:XP_642090.1 hypothetical protein DDB_G0278049 [Dictyostelium discoideum AX4]
MSSDSSFALYIHRERRLIDIVDNNWEQETLPQELIRHPTINENITLNEEFEELQRQQCKKEKAWNELALNSFN